MMHNTRGCLHELYLDQKASNYKNKIIVGEIIEKVNRVSLEKSFSSMTFDEEEFHGEFFNEG